jgi:hypothetical protein
MGSGISVFDRDCVDEHYGTTICDHIRAFYLTVTEEPIVYWSFDSSILGTKAILEKRESNTGDICHYDIENLSHREAEEIFRKHAKSNNFLICNVDDEEPFTIEKLRNLIN